MAAPGLLTDPQEIADAQRPPELPLDCPYAGCNGGIDVTAPEDPASEVWWQCDQCKRLTLASCEYEDGQWRFCPVTFDSLDDALLELADRFARIPEGGCLVAGCY